MEKENLMSIYESNYLNTSSEQEIVEEKKVKGDGDEEKVAPKKFKKKAKKSKKLTAGQMYCDSRSFDNMFDKILREMDENYGFGDEGDVDTDFDADMDDTGVSDEDEQMYSLSELKSMTLQEIADLISGVGGEEEYEDDFGGEGDFDDEIPTESVEGNYKGDQGTYDGKAKRQAPSTHVRGNGDANFDDQDTGYDPEDTEGSEGAYHGDQGTYDGKARRQSDSTHVKGNGDANIGKSQNTGYKTGSGKGKNFF